MRTLWILLKLSGLLAAVLAVAGLSALLAINYATSAPTMAVPSVVGLSQAEAGRRLDRIGLRIQFEDDQKSTFDDRVPQGHVLRQDPGAGTMLKKDRRVRVILSLGPRHLYVPRVVGETVSAAQLKLQQAGLKTGDVIYVRSALVPESAVINQASGRQAGNEGVVNLLVSSGASPNSYVMPDVISKSVLRVRARLELLSFRVVVEREAYEGVPEGTVIRHQPLAGYPVRAGETIRLWVSSGSGGATRPF